MFHNTDAFIICRKINYKLQSVFRTRVFVFESKMLSQYRRRLELNHLTYVLQYTEYVVAASRRILIELLLLPNVRVFYALYPQCTHNAVHGVRFDRKKKMIK